MEPFALTKTEIAALLGTTERAIAHMMSKGTIPHRKMGARVVFLPDEIQDWLHRLPGVSLTALREAHDAVQTPVDIPEPRQAPERYPAPPQFGEGLHVVRRPKGPPFNLLPETNAKLKRK
jgi:excisionase family DNA binding protein